MLFTEDEIHVRDSSGEPPSIQAFHAGGRPAGDDAGLDLE